MKPKRRFPVSRFVEPTPLSKPPMPFDAAEGDEPSDTTEVSDATQRIVKFMPVEIVTGYIFVISLVMAAPQGNLRTVAGWLVFAAGLIFTPIFLTKVYRPEPDK